MMNWMSSTSSRSKPRRRALNSIISFWRKGRDKFDHEALGRTAEDARAGMGLQIGMADRVQQMRLALAGRGLEVERRELRLFDLRHALGGVESEHVGRAGDEGRRRSAKDRGRSRR